MLFPLISLLAAAAAALPAQNVPDSELASWVAEAIIQDARGDSVAPREYMLSRGRRDDLDIATEVTGRLTAAGVYGMVVACSDGIVVLRGEIRDDALRTKAGRLAAAVPGARDVKNLLWMKGEPVTVLAPSAAGPRNAFGPARTEAFDFLTDDLYAGKSIVVAADNGVITLTGRVNTHNASTYAASIAARVPRVRVVRNQLSERPSSVALDKQMAFEVQLVLDFANLLQAFPNKLVVRVENGILSVEGRVVYESQRREALRLAWRAPGIFMVLDGISLDARLRDRPHRNLNFDELAILRHWNGELHTDPITPHHGPHSGSYNSSKGMSPSSY